MKNHRNYLAVDLGAESGRTIIGSIKGNRLTIEETHRFLNQPVHTPEGMQWDILRLWADIKKGIEISSDKTSKTITSIALDTWGVDFALLDRKGSLLSNPFHYRDERTNGMMKAAFKLVPKEIIYETTGNQFLELNTLYQLFSMAVNQSPLLHTSERFLTTPDFFNYWLCGSQKSEFTISTTTQCLNPKTGTWAFDLLEQLSIPVKIFPEIVQPGTILGPIRKSLARETHVNNIPVVAVAGHDTGSAVAAIPAENRNFAWISSGTWSIMGVVSVVPVISQKSLAYNFTNEGGVEGLWRLSKNVTGLWLVQECKREWGLSYDEITQLAQDAEPFMSVVDTDDKLFLLPKDMPEKIRRYCANTDQKIPETRGDIVRVALESLALKYRHVINQLEDLLDKKIEIIHIIGGGTKNKLLNQLAADATGKMIIAGPVEATAVGNVIMQAIALGDLKNLEEARELIRMSFETTHYYPHPDNRWDINYEKLLSMNKG